MPILSFRSIFEDGCFSRYEYNAFSEAYKAISNYLDYYNNRRRHDNIKPTAFYKLHLHTFGIGQDQAA